MSYFSLIVPPPHYTKLYGFSLYYGKEKVFNLLFGNGFDDSFAISDIVTINLKYISIIGCQGNINE